MTSLTKTELEFYLDKILGRDGYKIARHWNKTVDIYTWKSNNLLGIMNLSMLFQTFDIKYQIIAEEIEGCGEACLLIEINYSIFVDWYK